MKPADFSITFYKKCLSQHLWDWRDRFVTTAVVRHHEANEEMLKRVAHERGDEFLEAYNKVAPQAIFPFAGIPAAEIPNTPTTTKSMKIEVIIPDELSQILVQPIVQAINDLTTAVRESNNRTIPPYDGPLVGYNVENTGDKPKRGRKPKGTTEETPATAEETPATPAAEPVQATVETPQVVAPAVETTVVEEPPLSGPDLAKMAEPLAAHPELQKELIRYKKEGLKIESPIRVVTDQEALRKFHAKLTELLAKAAAEV